MVFWGNALVVQNMMSVLLINDEFPEVKYVSLTMLHVYSQNDFLGLKFHVLLHLKYKDCIFGLPIMKELNMYIQPSNYTAFFGDKPFSASHNRREGYHAWWLMFLKCRNF